MKLARKGQLQKFHEIRFENEGGLMIKAHVAR